MPASTAEPRARRLIVFAVATLVAVVLGRATNLAATGLALIWPAAGVVVLWWHEVRTRRGALVTAACLGAVIVLGNLATGAAPTITALFLGVNLVHAIVGAELLWRVRGRRRLVLDTVRDVAAAAVAALGAGLASSTVALIGTSLLDELPTWSSTGLLLVRNTSSTFLVLVLVAGARTAASAVQRARVGEATAMLGTTLALCVVLFGFARLPLAFSVLAVTVWSALRLGVRWTALHATVVSVAVVLFTLRGDGIFSAVTPTAGGVLIAQAFLVVLSAVGLSIASLHDELRVATAKERASSRRLAALIDAALVGHATVGLDGDDHGRFLAVNPALADMLGASVEELVGTVWGERVLGGDRAGLEDALGDLRRRAARSWTGELSHTTPDGDGRWLEVAIARVDDEGPLRASVQLLDVTERRELEADLTHLALHDALTGLPNRGLLLDRITIALADDERDGTHTAVLFLDLDDFKHVNDSFGHGAGDQLLITVGRRLQQAVRPGDTVARIGGDEFVVCCPGIHDVAQAFIVAERVLGVLRSPVELAPGTVPLGVSGGIALSSAGESARSLLRRSDTAMYAAKDRGRGRVEVFTDELRARSTRHLRIRSDLDGAIGRDEILCHYQPLVDLRTGAVVGAEALVRWRHGTRGLLLPEEWLDVAEGHGAIVSIGGHVLREACRWAVARPETATPLTVHVNISGRQLADSGTVDQVFSALDSSGLDPARLVLELTETHLLEAHSSLVRDLHTLRDRGVHLAADDFGTGFSSLSHLLALPLDQVKVDRSFVANALHDPRSAAIVRGLLVLAEGMELGVVAEGVESVEQARYLRELGCETGQGFLWSGAVPGDPWPWDDADYRRPWGAGGDPRHDEHPVPRSTDPGASAPTV